MNYNYLATSPAGFLHQLACYLDNGYFLYYRGFIRPGKDPFPIDRQVLFRYQDILLTKQQKYRREDGAAKTQYLRFGQHFLILSTEGESLFLSREAAAVRDARRVPILFQDHAASVREGRVHIQIDRNVFKRKLLPVYSALAVKETKEALEARLRALPFEPFAPVRAQKQQLLRLMNKKRRQANLDRLSPSCVRFGRKVRSPFTPLSPARESDMIEAHGP